MKQTAILFSLCLTLVLSSCGTYTGTGAYTGGMFGNMIGSAVGGIAGGWRGSDVGALIGTVGGAAVGAAIGHAADQAQEERAAEYARQRQQARQDSQQPVFDPTQSGDDRISFDGAAPYPGHVVAPASPQSGLQIRHVRFSDRDGNGVLSRGEAGTVTFEIVNLTNRTVYEIYPLVGELTGNRHVHVSPNVLIESLAPRQGIRYTANIQADRSLRDGEIILSIGVAQRNREMEHQRQQLRIRTVKKVVSPRRR